MKTAFRALVLAVVLVAAWFIWKHFFPSEETRIRRMLGALAELASVPEKTSVLHEATVASDLRNYFTPEVEIEVDVPLEGKQSFNGREELVQAIVLGRQHYRGAKVEFFGVELRLAPDNQSAIAELGLKATRGPEDIFVVELKLALRRDEKRWRISRADSVEVLKR